MSLHDTVDVIGIIIGIVLAIYGIYSSDLGLFIVGTLYVNVFYSFIIRRSILSLLLGVMSIILGIYQLVAFGIIDMILVGICIIIITLDNAVVRRRR